MLKEFFKGVQRVFQGCYKSVSRLFQEYFKGVSFSRVFREFFKGVTRVFQAYIQRVSRMFQGSLKTNFKRCFKHYWKCFKVVLFLKLYCCMPLIAATRAEGGLVYLHMYIFIVLFQNSSNSQTSIKSLLLVEYITKKKVCSPIPFANPSRV